MRSHEALIHISSICNQNVTIYLIQMEIYTHVQKYYNNKKAAITFKTFILFIFLKMRKISRAVTF